MTAMVTQKVLSWLALLYKHKFIDSKQDLLTVPIREALTNCVKLVHHCQGFILPPLLDVLRKEGVADSVLGSDCEQPVEGSYKQWEAGCHRQETHHFPPTHGSRTVMCMKQKKTATNINKWIAHKHTHTTFMLILYIYKFTSQL